MGYATDLPDNEWQILEPLLEPKQKGRPRKHGLRAICNAIRYVQRTGCQWRLLPNDFPPWRVVYMTFWRWRNSGLWERTCMNYAVAPAPKRDAIPIQRLRSSTASRSRPGSWPILMIGVGYNHIR